MNSPRSYLRYEQPFQVPLVTARGVWKERVSWVFREHREGGRVSYGEIAPIPELREISENEIRKEAEIWLKHGGQNKDFNFLGPALSCLNSSIWKLPCDSSSFLKTPARLWGINASSNGSVIKRKIGVDPIDDELPAVLEWLKTLPDHFRVRLDANESFSRDSFLKWADALEGNQKIEFIEQPTGRDDDDWLINITSQTSVPIALDESLFRIYDSSLITSLPRSLFLVIKPVLFPNWVKLFSDLEDRMNHVVFSTAFESPFGYESIIRLAADSTQVPGIDRSCFCGNKHEFPQHHEPVLSSPSVPCDQLDRLWQTLHQ
jgi:O-succinylbenzoate synthase